MARWRRRIGAVVAGFAATAVLSIAADAAMYGLRVFPAAGVRMSDAMFVVPAVYRAAFTAAGGWVTARLAPDHAMRHAAVLAGIGTLAGIGGVAAAVSGGDAMGPLWYAVTIPVSAVPCIGLGAWLAMRR